MNPCPTCGSETVESDADAWTLIGVCRGCLADALRAGLKRGKLAERLEEIAKAERERQDAKRAEAVAAQERFDRILAQRAETDRTNAELTANRIAERKRLARELSRAGLPTRDTFAVEEN
jgi:hypothetical protein